MSARQSAQLLPALFENFDDEQCLRVLHLGPALPETLEFFSGRRCQLYFTDPFAELPLRVDELAEENLRDRVANMMDLPSGARYDLCLFWDLLNYLGEQGVQYFAELLRPHIAAHTLAHGFGVHNLRAPQRDARYSIVAVDTLCVRERSTPLGGYAPLPQSRLQAALGCFEMKRSVLLADGRLEMLLGARP